MVQVCLAKIHSRKLSDYKAMIIVKHPKIQLTVKKYKIDTYSKFIVLKGLPKIILLIIFFDNPNSVIYKQIGIRSINTESSNIKIILDFYNKAIFLYQKYTDILILSNGINEVVFYDVYVLFNSSLWLD